MRIALTLVLLAVLVTPACAQRNTPVKVGDVWQKVHGNVTGNSPAETVELVVTSADKQRQDGCACLVVLAADGSVLWRGPRPKGYDDPEAFHVSVNTDFSTIELIGDIDGDGHTEVVVHEPGRGVSPFRTVLRWNGSALVRLPPGAGVLRQVSPGNRHFQWDRTPLRSRVRPFVPGCAVVVAFQRLFRPGLCEVGLVDSSSGAMRGPFVMQATVDGFTLTSEAGGTMPARPTSQTNGWLMRDSATRLVTAQDLAGHSARELTLIRNDFTKEERNETRDHYNAASTAYFARHRGSNGD